MRISWSDIEDSCVFNFSNLLLSLFFDASDSDRGFNDSSLRLRSLRGDDGGAAALFDSSRSIRSAC